MKKNINFTKEMDSLKEKEESIKNQFLETSNQATDNTKKIIKTTLTFGIIAILGYWIFNVSFPSKKKKKKKYSKGIWNQMAIIFLPYLKKLIEKAFSLEEKEMDSSSKEKITTLKNPD